MADIQIYKTHDNYMRPYVVEVIDGDLVKIYKNCYDCKYRKNNTRHKSKLLQVLIPKKIFIGKSPFNKMTEFSGGHGEEFDGNTILLHLDKSIYMLIWDQIYYLQLDGGVKDYVSPVGNNDIPYPYIVLNSDCCIIKDNSNWVSVWPKYDEDKPINRDNLYYYYWKQDLQPNEKKIKVKSVIVDEVINNSIDNIRRGNWHYCEYDSEGNYIRDENKNNNYIKCYIPQGTSDMNSSDDESN